MVRPHLHGEEPGTPEQPAGMIAPVCLGLITDLRETPATMSITRVLIVNAHAKRRVDAARDLVPVPLNAQDIVVLERVADAVLVRPEVHGRPQLQLRAILT